MAAMSSPGNPPSTLEDPGALRAAARALGFHRLGIAAAERSRHADRYLEWLAAGRHGAMEYLAREVARRIDPRESLPGARSVVVVSLPYDDDVPFPAPDDPGRARIARYARGRDYHRVMGAKLRRLAEAIREGSRFAAWWTVDSGPLLERDFAEAAGIGWIGKNALVIDPEIGSWIFLGAVVTDRPYRPDAPSLDQCGRCTRCLDACPTGALATPRTVDAQKCISYRTIEDRALVAEDQGATLAGWVLGCDICQEVCPWNTRPGRRRPAIDPDLAPRPLPDALDELGALDRDGFLARFRGTAAMRAGARRVAASARAVAAHRRTRPRGRPAEERR
jgi:epoxyqueuosine reductase